MSAEGRVRAVITVRGYVQGVGFRWYTRAKAQQLGLVGSATNAPDGSVHIVVECAPGAVDQLVQWLHGPQTPGSVDAVE